MTISKQARRMLISLASILLSIMSHYFFNGWINVIPWAIVALCIGYISNGRRDTIINGAIFGYLLFFVYIMIGYGGKTDTKTIITFILFALVFSLIGLLAGICGAFFGHLANQRSKTIDKTDKI
jgi:lipopolysaccharide export LptBFGC system permease protein LptF